MKKITILLVGMLLLAACGKSYEETKRISRQQRLEAMRADSAALKIAVMPTLDCLPLYVAQHYELFDTINGGVRLKRYTAHIDCEEAVRTGKAEGMVADLVRAMKMTRSGMTMHNVVSTGAYWQLVTNRNVRVRQLNQLKDKMVAMTRYSATDLLTDRAVDSAHLAADRVYKVQINDVDVRMLMLMNNEIDALWLTEPQATQARLMKHPVVMDSKSQDMQLGVITFNDKEMRREERHQQLTLFLKAYDQACDSIAKYGIDHYRNLIVKECKVKREVVDKLPKDITFHRGIAPRQKDVERVEKWLEGAR